MPFGKYIKDLREEKKITLSNFCKNIGYDKGNWSRIEQGITCLPYKKDTLLKKIMAVLDIPDSQYNKLADLACIARRSLPDDIAKKSTGTCMEERLLQAFSDIRNNHNGKQHTLKDTLINKTINKRENKTIIEDDDFWDDDVPEDNSLSLEYKRKLDKYKSSLHPAILRQKRAAHRKYYMKEHSFRDITEEEINNDFDAKLIEEMELID